MENFRENSVGEILTLCTFYWLGEMLPSVIEWKLKFRFTIPKQHPFQYPLFLGSGNV